MNEENEVEVMFYAGEGFYSSLFIATAYANGFSDEDLTEIGREEYDSWFNPPEGKVGAWVDGKPVLVDTPDTDYKLFNSMMAEALRSDAMSSVSVISAKIGMKRSLTQAETDKMNSVLDYCDLIDRVDISVEKPDWPDKPD